MEKTLDTISIFLNLLRVDLRPKTWAILENDPCALEKKVHSSAFGWNVLNIVPPFNAQCCSKKNSSSLVFILIFIHLN